MLWFQQGGPLFTQLYAAAVVLKMQSETLNCSCQ